MAFSSGQALLRNSCVTPSVTPAIAAGLGRHHHVDLALGAVRQDRGEPFHAVEGSAQFGDQAFLNTLCVVAGGERAGQLVEAEPELELRNDLALQRLEGRLLRLREDSRLPIDHADASRARARPP